MVYILFCMTLDAPEEKLRGISISLAVATLIDNIEKFVIIVKSADCVLLF
jgi:hypothetical protein